ncbi:unnamed protein product [Caenorhabditis bovis]|uniref:Uncharacterized protein n=1 Tax=Caenorhabditis bovis TaxID=2654633 RepID=A0A8S1FEW5_9PELO|nr:unnamed protein product [Caenorhabditis bovis]
MISFVATTFVVTKAIVTIWKVKQLHNNLNILLSSMLIQWYEAIIAKLIIIPFQHGLIVFGDVRESHISWWTSDATKIIQVHNFYQTLPLFVSGFAIWHYIYSLFLTVPALASERVVSTIFIDDYEKTSRLYVSISFLIVSQILSILFTLFTFFNILQFYGAILIASICVIFAIVIYIATWRKNYKIHQKMKRISALYTLAQRFQVKENIRVFKMAKNVVITSTIPLISLGIILSLFVQDVLDCDNSGFLIHLVDNCVILYPLLICPTLMLSTDAWTKSYFSSVPIIGWYLSKMLSRNVEVRKKASAVETDIFRKRDCAIAARIAFRNSEKFAIKRAKFGNNDIEIPMAFSSSTSIPLAFIAFACLFAITQSAVLPVTSTELAVVSESTTAVDTLGSSPSRVKRQGGCGCCGCGCGCCCCRPRCCCCCRRCCTCCRTCCCTRCCTCCRPCCCGCGCGCCGCGCCGCGGGRKRRSLQNLKIDAANKALGIKRRQDKC